MGVARHSGFAGFRQPASWLPVCVLIAGCQAPIAERNLGPVTQAVGALPRPLVVFESVQADAERARRMSTLLGSSLGQEAALELALLNSRTLQSVMGQGLAQIAEAEQTGRIPNPVLMFERMRSPDEREVGRSLSLGLLDLLTWPQRRATAASLSQAARTQLATRVVDELTAVRTTWVAAVAAEQRLGYARQVLQSAEASAELARRMETAGNFNRLARQRQQLFESQARAELAIAEQDRLAKRESLVRALGLDDAQAATLSLPKTLSALPAQPLSADQVWQRAVTERLDVALAEAKFQAAARAEGLTRLTSLGDLEGGWARQRTEKSEGDIERVSGYELEWVLPLFDAGDLRRGAASQRALAAANELEATLRAAGSNLRESYALYRNSYQVANLYLNEVIPLRKQVSEETLLRYNAMLIGVFELLADAREQRETVMQAIRAQEDFWSAEALLQAAVLGRPSTGGTLQVQASQPAVDPGH
jgi:outer membrane protein TolC